MMRSASNTSAVPSSTGRTRKPVNYTELGASGPALPQQTLYPPAKQDHITQQASAASQPALVSHPDKTPVKSAYSESISRFAPPPRRVQVLPIPGPSPSIPQAAPAALNVPLKAISSPINAAAPSVMSSSNGVSERPKPLGARKMTTDADLSWKELYEDLYEKSCALEHDQALRIQELKRTVSELEFQVVNLQKQLIESSNNSRKEAVPRSESNDSLKENRDNDLSRDLDASVAEVQELSCKIKKALNITVKPASTTQPTTIDSEPSASFKTSSSSTAKAPAVKVEPLKHISTATQPEKTASGQVNHQLGTPIQLVQDTPIPHILLNTKPDHKILTDSISQCQQQRQLPLSDPKPATATTPSAKQQSNTAKPIDLGIKSIDEQNDKVVPENGKKEGSFESDLLNIMNSFGF
ncbi:hypothetical protein BDR26DRAFT_920992 [Obelidium mucronatum]|nr:hypothetical protein BDR26DRAFT_920992 [Obelidium mucronatum]